MGQRSGMSGARLGSERQDDRAVRSRDYLAQRLCRLFERTDGGDRHAKGAVGQQLREGRKLPTIGPDVDVGYGDATFLPRRVARDRGEAAAVSNRLQCGGRLPGGSVDGLGRAAAGDLANERSPVAVVVEHLRRAVVAGALGLLRARGRDYAAAPSRGELDEQATRDSAGSVDDDPAAALDPKSLVECLSRSERRNGKRCGGFP